MIRLVLFSADSKLRALLAAALKADYDVVLESNKDNLRQVCRDSAADILILDFDCNRTSLDQQLSFYDDLGMLHIPCVVMTDDVKRSTATQFMQRGAHDCIRRPPSLVEFKVIVGRAYEHALIKKELEMARLTLSMIHGCDQLVGSSPQAQAVYGMIRRVADLHASILITGESGTGKELVARAIHSQGKRANYPFIAVSCGAIPETLIEAELFGCERGAFTGANVSRPGYLEQAGEGTVLLDEIGELSLNTQVKLLRVLQQKEFSRLGSSRVIPLRARVLFATHRNLQQMVEEGTFRRDMFYRVNVTTINVPPLRDRTEDIPALARHFLKRYAAEFGRPVEDIRPSAMDALVEYEWPGNIRELENVIQGATILADGGLVSRGDLPAYLLPSGEDELADGEAPEGFEGLLHNYKVNLAIRAIADCNGNKTLAAKRLRVSRAYLHRLIRLTPVGPDEIGKSNLTRFRPLSNAS